MTIKEQLRRCARLSDEELWDAMPALARRERRDVVTFLIYLMELKRREILLARAYPGVYSFLVSLGFSEFEARARSIAVGAAAKYRSVLGLLQAGRLTLSALAVIGPYLKPENYRSLLRKACRRSKRDLEKLVASLAPQAPRRDVARVVSAPAPAPPSEPSPEAPPAVAFPADSLFPGEPLSCFEKRPAGEVRLRQSFDCSEELQDKIRRAKEILSNKYPSGRLEFILDDALEALLERIDPARRHARRLQRRQRQMMKGAGASGSA